MALFQLFPTLLGLFTVLHLTQSGDIACGMGNVAGGTFLRCLCNFNYGLADCADRQFILVPKFTPEEVFQIHTMTLDYNNIQSISPQDFNKSLFISLETLYIRGNPNLDCETLHLIPSDVLTISDCAGSTRRVSQQSNTR